MRFLLSFMALPGILWASEYPGDPALNRDPIGNWPLVYYVLAFLAG